MLYFILGVCFLFVLFSLWCMLKCASMADEVSYDEKNE